MDCRVIFSANAIKMSPAGLDARTASNAQLLFNADGSPYNGAWLVGRIPAGAFAESAQGVSGGTRYTRTASIGFGKTFGAPPRALVGIIDPATGCFTSNCNFNSAGQGSTSGTNTGSALSMSYTVSQTGLSVTITYVFFSGSGFNRNVDVSYVIFQV